MSAKVYENGAWRDVNSAKVYENGAWRDVSSMRVYDNGGGVLERCISYVAHIK